MKTSYLMPHLKRNRILLILLFIYFLPLDLKAQDCSMPDILLFGACSESLCPDKLKAEGDSDGGLAQSFYLRWQPSPNNYQYAIGVTGIYSEDTIMFYNENYEIEPTFYTDGRAGNFFYASPSTPRGQDLSKTYYLYLNYQDTDTIRIDYKINENKCKPLLVYGKFFYNNQLITQNENENFIPVAGIDK